MKTFIKQQLGGQFWLDDERTGVLRVEGNFVRRAPRMTVIDSVCNTAWKASIISTSCWGVITACMVASFLLEPAAMFKAPILFTASVFLLGLLAQINGAIANKRLDSVMSVVGAERVKGIFYDWGSVDQLKGEQEADARSGQTSQPVDYDSLLPDDGEGVGRAA